MTKQQIQAVLGLIKTAYPGFGGDNKPEDIAALWANMFSADPPDVVMTAVYRHIATGKFPPTIAEIRAIIADIAAPLPSLMDLWDEARRLLQSGIAPDNERAAYERMSPACKAATIAAGGWYALSMSEDGQAERAFLRAAKDYLAAEHSKRIMSLCLPGQSGGIPALTEGDGHG